jgi:hypothetical protein
MPTHEMSWLAQANLQRPEKLLAKSAFSRTAPWELQTVYRRRRRIVWFAMRIR